MDRYTAADRRTGTDKVSGTAPSGEPTAFSERLTIPSAWHLGAVAFAVLAGSYPGAYLDASWSRALVYLALFAMVEAGLWWAGYRVRLHSDGTTFSAAGRAVPLSRVAGVTVVADIKTVLVPNTFAVTRPWISGGVLVTLHDAAASELGWVLSSRRGERLAAALTR